jgi:glycosyltransferase involved in cell wall biosynthesis
MTTHPALSICTTIKNRSGVHVDGRVLELFPNCVASLRQAVPEDLPCELVVTDWESDDWPLEEWLEAAAHPLPVRLVTLHGKFSRGAGRNAAARAARADRLLFLDADCLACERLLSRGVEVVDQNAAYFPILFSYFDPEHRDGWWRSEGYGNCVVSRGAFETIGGFPEYNYWGREDNGFFDLAGRIQKTVRERVEGFYHQWHPNDIVWKNQYGVASEYVQAVLARHQEARESLEELFGRLPCDRSVILVDQAHFNFDLPPGRRVYPFLERDGCFWGNPADSEQAIGELERLREKGAGYIAFAWMAFWWLDYYAEFRSHLQTHYRPVFENGRFKIFDIQQPVSGKA